ncbi:MAG: hypothetical protein K2H85_08970 [Allobaculum sp.]|nr:hypothetical protein [Allobaculum sp.]
MLDINVTADYKQGRKSMKKKGTDLTLNFKKQEPLPISYRNHLLQKIISPTRDLHTPISLFA